MVAITDRPLEPVTTITAATIVDVITSTQDGGTDSISMATETTPNAGSTESTAGMITNTGPGVLGSSSTATPDASADLTSSSPDMNINIAANQETANKRMYLWAAHTLLVS